MSYWKQITLMPGKVPFTGYEAGVYVIYNSKNEVEYIGSSMNLRHRMYNHTTLLRWLRKSSLSVVVKYREIGKLSVALWVERRLIKRLLPSSNRVFALPTKRLALAEKLKAIRAGESRLLERG